MADQPATAATYMPGDRVRLTIEGTCVVGDTDHVYLQLDDGSTWHFLPAIAKIEKVANDA